MFAWGYDRFLSPAEQAGLQGIRREPLSEGSRRCLEVGAGTGLNLEHWPGDVEELVLTEPDPHMSSQLQRMITGSARAAAVG